jgi:hypothetical protein
MKHGDEAAISILTEATRSMAEIDGPISGAVASGVLLVVSTVVLQRRAPISLATLEAMMGLVVALKEDITA